MTMITMVSPSDSHRCTLYFLWNNLVGTKHEGAGNKTLGTSQSIEINGNGDVLMNYLRTYVRVGNQLALTSRLPRPLYLLPPTKRGGCSQGASIGILLLAS